MRISGAALYLAAGFVPAVVVAGVLSLAAGGPAATGPGSGDPPATADPTVHDRPDDADGRHCAEQPERIARLETRARGLRAHLRALHAEEIALVGEPATWPDAPPQGLAPADAEALADRLRDAGYLVHDVDCAEPPCLISLVRPPDLSDVHERFPERFRFDVAVPIWLESEALGEGSGHVIELGHRRFEGVGAERLDWRLELASEALLEAAEAGEVSTSERGGDRSVHQAP